jgi:hypothetical protein
MTHATALATLESWTIDELRAELEAPVTDDDVEHLARWLNDGHDPAPELVARIKGRLANEYDPDNDGPRNPCGFCGMREAAPGYTACSSCA